MGAKTLLTIGQLAGLHDESCRYELDEGELITLAPASEEHGDIGAEIVTRLRTFAKERNLGKVYMSDTGFILSPDTLRLPDVAFVKSSRLGERNPRHYFEGPPDLAVEVFSPSDSVPQLMRKVRQYLGAGCECVWVVYPAERRVHVFRAGATRILDAADVLEAPALLPGFSVLVSDLFPE